MAADPEDREDLSPRSPQRIAALLFSLDRDARVPLHAQILAAVRERIRAGELRPGARLPSSRQLAADLGVSRATVVQALDGLAAEGYLVSRAGSATTVAADLPVEAGAPRAPPRVHHAPRLTAAARALTRLPVGTARLGAAPRAFRPGVPALDCFPLALWSRLSARRHARASTAMLEGGEPAGWAPLRQAIAAHVSATRGVACVAEQVFVTSGTLPAVDEILRLVVEPGADVWIEDPAYLGTRRSVLAAGARAVPVPVDADGSDIAAGVARAPGARAVVLAPSHQYPLGVTLSQPRRLALLRWAARAHLAADCGETLRVAPGETGMQLLAWLSTRRSDRRVAEAAAALGVEVGALSSYRIAARQPPGLVLGFGGVAPEAMRAATRRLARALAA